MQLCQWDIIHVLVVIYAKRGLMGISVLQTHLVALEMTFGHGVLGQGQC